MTKRTHIKICGIRTPDMAQVAVDAGADMVGLVFVDRSPRQVTIAQARAVAEAVGDHVQLVGLFKDQSAEVVMEHAMNVPLGLLQLHGTIDDTVISGTTFPPYMPAVAFDQNTLGPTLRDWSTQHDADGRIKAVIIDTPDPSRIGGGTGQTFDWDALAKVLERVKPTVPIVLAGGLTPSNVAKAIRIVRPWMVDVSSGVESSRGVKDADLIRAFCQAVQDA